MPTKIAFHPVTPGLRFLVAGVSAALILFSSASRAERDDLLLPEELDATALASSDLAGLSGSRGIDVLQLYNAGEQISSFTNNTIRSGATGLNIVSDDAFSNAVGFTTIIQNSGNGVVIQDSTMINLYFGQ
jgi:hypothetical protein